MSSAIHVWVCGFRSTIVEPSSRRVFTANRTRPCALNTSYSAQSGVQYVSMGQTKRGRVGDTALTRTVRRNGLPM